MVPGRRRSHRRMLPRGTGADCGTRGGACSRSASKRPIISAARNRESAAMDSFSIGGFALRIAFADDWRSVRRGSLQQGCAGKWQEGSTCPRGQVIVVHEHDDSVALGIAGCGIADLIDEVQYLYSRKPAPDSDKQLHDVAPLRLDLGARHVTSTWTP